ncbi:MAG: hypothetical protein HKO93_04680 [Flavobacteriales bacterium]|nr:hypothetical protein [Flavobacteriales bacterium]
MIKFFRRIRQRLLSENRFSKYLIYAIGEIVLVVIGILIALQVSDWSKEKERNALEVKMLNELLVNLRADSVDHSINFQWYERAERSAALVVSSLESRTPWHDSMATHYGNLFTHGIATLNTSAYDNLKTLGFDLISNDSIRIALTKLHSINYELLKKTEMKMAMDNGNTMVLPVLTSRLKMIRWFHALPQDYDRLLDDMEFREVVRFRGNVLGYVKGNTRDANGRVFELIRMIERELETRN